MSKITGKLQTESRAWPDTGRPRRAGVSSFGISGTNAHLILEQPPSQPDPVRRNVPVVDTSAVMVPVSAKTESALRQSAARLLDRLSTHPDVSIADVSRTLATGRAHLAHRGAVVAADRDELLSGLAALATGSPAPNLVTGRVPAAPGRTVFVFPGQGSQYAGMAGALYRVSPVFREQIDACARALAPHVDWSLAEVITDPDQDAWLSRIDVVQPALWAIMVALTRLWQSVGIQPDAVIGHSQGEIAAAHIAGILTLHDAARVIASRSKVLTALCGQGRMAVLALSEHETLRLLDNYDGQLVVAAVNSPVSTVVSGDRQALGDLMSHCHSNNIRALRLLIDCAAHSPHVDAVTDCIQLDLAAITPRPAAIPFYSTVEGHLHDTPLDGTQLGAAYWADNLRRPVQFHIATQALLADGHTTFLEPSTHPTLIPAIQDTIDDQSPSIQTLVTGTLHCEHEDTHQLLTAVAHLHTHGTAVDWPTLYPNGQHIDLPTYPFQHKHYWLAPTRHVGDVADVGLRAAGHGLLGTIIELPDDQGLLMTGRVSLATHAWLAGHAMRGAVILAGTAYLDMALHAASLAGCPHLAELVVHTPLVLAEDNVVDLQLHVGPAAESDDRAVTVRARVHNAADDDLSEWTVHATARLTTRVPTLRSDPAPSSWPPETAEPVDLAVLYSRLAQAGYEYGAAFTGLRAAWRHGPDLYTETCLPEELTVTGHTIHPALLDAALHPVVEAVGGEDSHSAARMIFAFTDVAHTAGPGREIRRLRVHLHDNGADKFTLFASDITGAPVLTIEAVALRPAAGDLLHHPAPANPVADLLHLVWSPYTTSLSAPNTAGWVLAGADREVATAFRDLPRCPDLTGCTTAIGSTAPEVVMWVVPRSGSGGEDCLIEDEVPTAAHELSQLALRQKPLSFRM
ncbi:acyltransferase domain-containing protein [Streptomyces sp. MMS24-I2-30]|uniref:acyltransferase domain-containing protein n=1 Tax=Streptomyces sp. MMS24-I2-30 TaxID=3351564 RepID=UPI003896A8D3